jgi:hypothetical protein
MPFRRAGRKQILPKMKYRNIKSGGYDSKKEHRRAFELKALEKAGLITDLNEQVKFVLIPKQVELIEQFGKKGPIKPKEVTIEQECSYVADFTYIEKGQFIVEDTKGFKTPDYKIKRKLMLFTHKIKIKET